MQSDHDAMSLADALHAWMNTFPEVKSLGARSLADFRDGVGITHIWNAIGSPQVDIATLFKPKDASDWLSCLRNLRAIDQTAAPLLTQNGLREKADLTAAARKSQIEELVKIIKPLVSLSLQSAGGVARLDSLPAPIRQLLSPDDAANPDTELAESRQLVGDLEAALRDLDSQISIRQRDSPILEEKAAEMSGLISGVEGESADLTARLAQSQAEEADLSTQVASLESRQAILVDIELLEQALATSAESEAEFSRLRADRRVLELEVGAMEEEIEGLKEEITTSIQLTEKYGADLSESDSVQECDERVGDLANRISQMEVEKALLRDAVESGQSGVPGDLLKEQEELKQVVRRLLKRKKQLEDDAGRRQQLREELQRVQKLIVDQREEVEQELERLAGVINVRNTELTSWVAYTSAFDAWRQSPTFISEWRRQYL